VDDADRIAAKPSKADLVWSDAHVREVEQRHRMNTDPRLPIVPDAVLAAHRHLRLDNTGLAPEETARRVLAWLDPGVTATDSPAPRPAPYDRGTGV
jgi:hypothetical protein